MRAYSLRMYRSGEISGSLPISLLVTASWWYWLLERSRRWVESKVGHFGHKETDSRFKTLYLSTHTGLNLGAGKFFLRLNEATHDLLMWQMSIGMCWGQPIKKTPTNL